MHNMPDFDDDCCNMDNPVNESEMIDRPYEQAAQATKRDTPIKRNALAAKMKTTRQSKRAKEPASAV